jgi:ABC-2 type transport system ATP-binding protein
MIEVTDLIYDYPAARAVHGISFSVRPGAVLAMVGPNGAGKTTLLRCMAALDTPTSGRIRIAGIDTAEDPRGVHAVLGYLPDFFGLYDELSVRRSLIYAARSRGVGADRAEQAAQDAARRVNLHDRMETRAGELSRGLRQRLAIACTLVHGPKVLLLDEPASGLDPEARRSLSDLVTSLSGEGITVVVSSHILAELEDYSTDMLMIREGRVSGGGVVSAGLAADAAHAHLVIARPRPDLREAIEHLGLTVEQATDINATVAIPGGPDQEAAVLARLIGAGLPVRSFAPARRTLEQTYLEEAAKGQARGATPHDPARNKGAAA